jgi:ABC-type transport system involved in multi-copper enzyme maturation permease subunit
MIWLTWRQARVQVSVIFGTAATLAVLLAVTRPGLLSAYHADGTAFLDLLQADKLKQGLYLLGVGILYATPPIIGAFWGAPLIARELESGTHRLVWNQSLTRNRWLAIKLGLTGLAAVVTTGLLSLAISWWSSPIDQSVAKGNAAGPFNFPRIYPVVFGARGLVPVGYTVFALALGVTVGLILRRSVPAVAITLALVVAFQIAVPVAVREHLVAPVRIAVKITPSSLTGIHGHPPHDGNGIVIEGFTVKAGKPGDWMLSNKTINSAGKGVQQLPSWVEACVPAPPGAGTTVARAEPPSQACFTRLADAGYRQQVTYQPASHFWALQWRETTLFVGLAGLLTGFCFWRIRRDLS